MKYGADEDNYEDEHDIPENVALGRGALLLKGRVAGDGRAAAPFLVVIIPTKPIS